MSQNLLKGALVVAGVVLVVILPHVVPVMQVSMLTEIAFFSLFAVSYNMLFGYAGLLSFGHAAYFGIGAYTVALVLKHLAGFPLIPSLLAGGIAGGLGGLLAGFFCVRLKGGYFALLTMAFNQLFFAVALKWRSVTRGDDGLSLKRPDLWLPGLGRVDMANMVHVYYVVVAVAILCILIQWYLTKTPLGNSIRAVKENDERADFLGYNVFRTKLTIYTISAFFAGIAGSLFAFFQGFVSTSCMDAGASMHVIFMAFIGGTGSFFGPVLGAGVYLYFTDWVSRLTDRWEFVLGVLFILLVMYARTGLIGLIKLEKLKGLMGFKSNVRDIAR